MIQATVPVSVPLELVIVKLVAAVLADTRNHPGVPPSEFPVKNILEEAVTFVVLTVTVPPTSVATPIVALLPSVILSPEPNGIEGDPLGEKTTPAIVTVAPELPERILIPS